MKRKIELKNVKGTYDYLPNEQKIRNFINDTLKNMFEKYGYQPLETPIICYYDMLAGKYDESNDLLNEIYKLTDQGNRKLGLRYDLTVPFAKCITITKDLKLPFKRYEIGKVFRDGPVKTGRDREFIQCDVDVVGIQGQMIEDELKREQGMEVEEEDTSNKSLLNVTTHISDNYVSDEDIKIEIHQKINEIDSYDKLLEIKNELEDRFGQVTDDMLVYMYEEWFEKIAQKYNIKEVVQTDRLVEVTLPEEVSNNIKGDKLLIEAMSLTKNFNISYKNNNFCLRRRATKFRFYLYEIND